MPLWWLLQIPSRENLLYGKIFVKSLPNPSWLFLAKVVSNVGPIPRAWVSLSLCSPNEDLEWTTKDEIQIFDRLFNCKWPKSSTHALEKCFLRKFRNPDFIFCSSFQNLRLGGIKSQMWFTTLLACVARRVKVWKNVRWLDYEPAMTRLYVFQFAYLTHR